MSDKRMPPGVYERFVRAGDAARDVHNWSAAEAAYKTALDKGAPEATFNVQLGHALKEQGKLAEAEQCYRTALALDADNADTHVQLGHVLKLRGRRVDAAAAYKKACSLDTEGSTEAEMEYFALTGKTATNVRSKFTVLEMQEAHSLLLALRSSHAESYGLFDRIGLREGILDNKEVL